jgi:hypothetical protein
MCGPSRRLDGWSDSPRRTSLRSLTTATIRHPSCQERPALRKAIHRDDSRTWISSLGKLRNGRLPRSCPDQLRCCPWVPLSSLASRGLDPEIARGPSTQTGGWSRAHPRRRQESVPSRRRPCCQLPRGPAPATARRDEGSHFDFQFLTIHPDAVGPHGSHGWRIEH